MLSSNRHVMLSLTVFRYLQSDGKNLCLRGQNWFTRGAFLTTHLVPAKDITTKRGETHSGTQLCPHASVQASWLCHCQISVPEHKDRENYSRFNVRQNAYERCVCRIIIIRWQCSWWCHCGIAFATVHSVYVINVEIIQDSDNQLLTLRPSQLTRPVSLPIAC